MVWQIFDPVMEQRRLREISSNLFLKDIAQNWHVIISFQILLVSLSHKVKPNINGIETYILLTVHHRKGREENKDF